MLYFSYGRGFMKLDDEGSYLMPDYLDLACNLTGSYRFSTEVDVINSLKCEFVEKGKGKTFVDIGAHCGTYSIVLSRVFDEVVAFEPEIHTYNILCGNMALHNLSHRSRCYNVALADKDEEVTYVKLDDIGGNNYCYIGDDELSKRYYFVEDQERICMKARTLDSYNLDNIGLIKIDVEGFETKVLQGSVETLKRNGYPPIVVESWRADSCGEDETTEVGQFYKKTQVELFTFLHSIGYEITPYDLDNDLYRCEYKG